MPSLMSRKSGSIGLCEYTTGPGKSRVAIRGGQRPDAQALSPCATPPTRPPLGRASARAGPPPVAVAPRPPRASPQARAAISPCPPFGPTTPRRRHLLLLQRHSVGRAPCRRADWHPVWAMPFSKKPKPADGGVVREQDDCGHRTGARPHRRPAESTPGSTGA